MIGKRNAWSSNMRKKNLSNFLFLMVLTLFVVFLIISQIKKQPQRDQASTQSVELSVTQTLAAFLKDSIQTPTAGVVRTTPSPTVFQSTPIPESFYIRDIIGHGQYFALGCEANAAVDLAGYYDIQIYQYNFQQELPISDNPDFGFVGDVNGPWGQVPPYAYGVYPAPVVDVLQKYGLDVVGGKGYTLEEMKKQLAQSKPIIVWVIGNMVGGVPAEYTDSKGNKTIVAAYQHVVILTGYDADSVRYMNNGRFADAPYEVFLNSWGVLGNMALFHR
jgi:uncharacterized protein YvpB